jgi:plasmid stabilization system protein ParE
MTRSPAPLGPKTLVVTKPARSDIDDQLAYLARQAGLDTALRFADVIDAALAKLAFVGHSGVSREEVSPGLRLLIVGNFSVYFRVTTNETRIIHVLRGSRDITNVDFG